MINFIKKQNFLLICYSNEGKNPQWVIEKFNNEETATLNLTFHFNKENLFKKENLNERKTEGLTFLFGTCEDEYYKIEKSILNITNDLYIHKKFKLDKKLFVADYNISIFKHIDQIITEPLYLGGTNKNAISYENFYNLLKDFPNTTERKKYCSARLSAILSVYFENRKEVIEKYTKHMNKKKSYQGINLFNQFRSYEKKKYQEILKKLKSMLKYEKKIQ